MVDIMADAAAATEAVRIGVQRHPPLPRDRSSHLGGGGGADWDDMGKEMMSCVCA